MKTSAKNYLDFVRDTYVEPGHDVMPEVLRSDVNPLARLALEQIASLTDAIDRLQKRVEELERREPW